MPPEDPPPVDVDPFVPPLKLPLEELPLEDPVATLSVLTEDPEDNLPIDAVEVYKILTLPAEEPLVIPYCCMLKVPFGIRTTSLPGGISVIGT